MIININIMIAIRLILVTIVITKIMCTIHLCNGAQVHHHHRHHHHRHHDHHPTGTHLCTRVSFLIMSIAWYRMFSLLELSPPSFKRKQSKSKIFHIWHQVKPSSTLISLEDLLVVLPSSVSYITAEYLCSSPPPSQPTGLWLWPARWNILWWWWWWWWWWWCRSGWWRWWHTWRVARLGKSKLLPAWNSQNWSSFSVT